MRKQTTGRKRATRLAKERKQKTNTLGIELKTYTVQGTTYKQQDVNFEYRLRVLAKELWARWNKFYLNYIKKTIQNSLTDKDFKLAIQVVNLDELHTLLTSTDKNKVKHIQAKLTALRTKSAAAFEALAMTLSFLTQDMAEAMDLFVTDRENLKNLFDVMFAGDIEPIQFEGNNPKVNLELDQVGKEVLHDFFTLKNKQIF